MPKANGSRLVYRKFDEKEIVDIFSDHPANQEQTEINLLINQAFIECAMKVIPLLPNGPGKNVAVRKMANARMACRAAVALEGKF